ncbi:MAG TPA: heavy metal translocating P-type ATPase [Ruminococcaceae bacterium]|nr:heavy metal translocating P-type ATPase [Oscillospiraceae bacterium]
MKCTVLHESKGRIRVRMAQKHMSISQADILEVYLKRTDGVVDAKVYDLTCDAVIFYKEKSDRADIISALASFSYEKCKDLTVEHSSRALNREFSDKLFFTLVRRCVNKFVFPVWLRTVITLFRSVKYIKAGLKCLLKGKIQVPVLDMTAIVVSLIRGDFATAGSIMFLLGIGDILDEWTHKKSVADLAGAMSINVDRVWLEGEDGNTLVPVGDVKVGDRIVVHTGNMIPLDGKVVSGEALINQSSITGEPLPVRRSSGGYVYAGTVVEEGDCVIRVEKVTGDGRYDRIVHMIEDSEKLKSETEDHASHLADKLVPYSLGATALIWLLTRNVTKALAVLMVDFSCALKLSMPVTVLSAMREASAHKISVKGGKFLEAVSSAETVVFDKTGTLTKAEPKVAEIVCFGGSDEEEMLKLAACLEEHYPHSMAKAVVAEAASRGLNHEERHSKVEYIVAHGISSSVDGKKVIIGSQHFVFEDEKCVVPDGDLDKFNALKAEYSHLYLAVSGVLAAVICIEDPLRAEAKQIITELKKLGIKHIVMMTGDNEKTACSVARAVGIDEYYSEVLPEDKAAFVRSEHEKGHKVIMLGDGVNDSPALSQADVGIAISDGAAIAREVADIMIGSDDLYSLVTLKRLSDALMTRIHSNYRKIIGFNLMLIILGVAGILPPATSALLHNALTLEISVKGMTNLLKE